MLGAAEEVTTNLEMRFSDRFLHMNIPVLVKNLHSSALYGHWVPSRSMANRDGWQESQGNLCSWHAMMIVIIICHYQLDI